MTRIQLIDTLYEIDLECDKIRAVILKLFDTYETADGAEPTAFALKPEAVNSKPDTAEYNAFKFICGYNEIIQFIHIAFDYVCKISDTAKQAVSE